MRIYLDRRKAFVEIEVSDKEYRPDALQDLVNRALEALETGVEYVQFTADEGDDDE